MDLDAYRRSYAAEDAATGWDAIDQHLAALHGPQEPLRLGTGHPHALGGPDPLDGISIYRSCRSAPHLLPAGTVHRALRHFQVVEISPGARNASWVYVTAGLSGPEVPPEKRCEFLLHAEHADAAHVRLLCLLAWVHLTGETLGIGRIMEIGEPWVPGSILDRLLVYRLHPIRRSK